MTDPNELARKIVIDIAPHHRGWSAEKWAQAIAKIVSHLEPIFSSRQDWITETEKLRAQLEAVTRNRCEHCGAKTIDNCLVCGAPQCCPACCRVSTLEGQLEAVTKENTRLDQVLRGCKSLEAEAMNSQGFDMFAGHLSRSAFRPGNS